MTVALLRMEQKTSHDTELTKGHMARFIDMNRLGTLAVALLVFMAALGPVCFMTPDSAMAMPMGSEMVPCDFEGSSATCPYVDEDRTVGSKAPSAQQVALALAIAVAPVPADSSVEAPTPPDTRAVAPPAHLIPLRI